MLHFDHREHGHPGTMPTLELGPDVFPGTQTTMLFFYWSSKVLPVCWGFNSTGLPPIAERDKSFGGLLGHLFFFILIY